MKLSRWISVSCMVAVITANVSAIESDDLVLYLSFDGGSGATAVDMSGNGNDGAVLGGATWTSGVIGGALEFNGTNSAIEIASNESFQMDNMPFTIEAWIKMSPDSAQWARIVDKYFGSGYVLGRRAGDLVVGAEVVGSPNNFASVTQVIDNQWHHIALTRSVANNTNLLRLYVDGLLENETTGGAAVQRNADTTPVRVGAGDECCEEGGAPAYWFRGTIDEVAIYKVELTGAEIQKDMDGVLPSTTSVDPSGKLGGTWGGLKSTLIGFQR